MSKSSNPFIEPPDLIDHQHYEEIDIGDELTAFQPKYESEILHRRDLPKWYKLEDYEHCKDFHAFEWWYQFSERMTAVCVAGMQGCVAPYQKTKALQETRKQWKPCLYSDGGKTYNWWYVVNQDRVEHLTKWQKAKARFFELHRNQEELECAVRPLDQNDVFMSLIQEDVTMEVGPKIDDRLLAYRDNFYQSFLDTDSDVWDKCWVKINPYASKEVLMDSFSHYVDSLFERKYKVELKRIGAIEFRRWSRNNYLACIDLCIWSNLKRVIIKDEAMAEFLDIYRSYVKKDLNKFSYYQQLLSTQCIHAMQVELLQKTQ